MTTVSTHPDADELRTLRRWAVVAFAARCGRGVSPLFQTALPDAPERHAAAIERGIVAAESAARQAEADEESSLQLATDITNAVNDACDQVRSSADASVGTSVADAVQTAVSSISRPRDVAASDAARVAETALQALRNHRDREIVSAAMRRDFDILFDILNEAAREQGWTDQTPVAPDVFGPMRPRGEPIG